MRKPLSASRAESQG